MEFRDEVFHFFEDIRKKSDAELRKCTKNHESSHAALIRKLKAGLRNNKLRDVIAGHNTLKIANPEEKGFSGISTIIEQESNTEFSTTRQSRRAAAKIATERTTETFKKFNLMTKMRRTSEKTTNVKRQSHEALILERPLKSQRLENKLYAGTRIEENDHYNEEPPKKFEKKNSSPKVVLINMSDSFIKKNSRKRKSEEDEEELSLRTDKRLSEDLFVEPADLGSEKSVKINLNSQNDTKYKSRSRRISGMENVSPLINVEDNEKKLVINKSSINSPEKKSIVSGGKISQQSKEESNDFPTDGSSKSKDFEEMPIKLAAVCLKRISCNELLDGVNPTTATRSVAEHKSRSCRQKNISSTRVSDSPNISELLIESSPHKNKTSEDLFRDENSCKDLPERSVYGKETEANGKISYANRDEVTASTTTNNLRNADDPGKVDNISEKLTESCVAEAESLKPKRAPRTRTKVLKKDDPSEIDTGISETSKENNEKNSSSEKDSHGELEISKKLAGSCVEVESLKPERAVRTRTKMLKKEDRSEIDTGISETSKENHEKNSSSEKDSNGELEISKKLAGSCVEVESLKPERAVRTRTKMLKKEDRSEIDTGISETSKENHEKNSSSEKDSNGELEISKQLAGSCVELESLKPKRALRTRTKVLKKEDRSENVTGITETSKETNEKNSSSEKDSNGELEISEKLAGSCVEVESLKPERAVRTRTKVLKKTDSSEIDIGISETTETNEKNSEKDSNGGFEISEKVTESCVQVESLKPERALRTRTKVLKKADPSEINTGISETSKINNEKSLENNSNGGFESEIDNTEGTKVFGNENAAESKPEIISPEHSTRTRTKRLKKTTHPETQIEIIDLSESITKSIKREATVELKSGRSTRARTKGLKKDISQTPDHDERPTAVITPFDDSSDVPAISPLLNNQQKTRTKVQEMAKKLEDAIIFHNTPKQDSSKTKKILDGKENSKTKPIPSFVNSVSYDKAQRGTPLQTNNRIMTPFQSSKLISSTSKVKVIVKQAAEEAERKRKEEEQLRKLQKEAEAQRKREERILAAKEETRRKREEKRQKVTAAREAAEKGKTELLAKLEKEREEKEAQVKAEKLKQKQELMMQKRQNLLMKAQEAEERRVKEETARLAKLKEQEEEQRRLAQIRLKQQLEAEKLFHQRQEEEQRTKAAQLNLKEKLKLKKKPLPQSYVLTPPRDEREPLRPKNDEDYGIDDVDPNDSSDNENEPKKMLPAWALRGAREISVEKQTYVAHHYLDSLFTAEHITPDLNAMFGEQTNIRVRTSSAVWTTPMPLINVD